MNGDREVIGRLTVADIVEALVFSLTTLATLTALCFWG